MEKVKEFLTSPKKTAILGLVGSIIMLIILIFRNAYNFEFGFGIVALVNFIKGIILSNLSVIGFLVYFTIVCMRLYKGKGNIKVANIILIVTTIITVLSSILCCLMYGVWFEFGFVLKILMYTIITIYFCNILLRKTNLLNNKIFAISIVAYVLFTLFTLIINDINFYSLRYLCYIIYQLIPIGYLAIIPYFYNYYNLLKGENKNGK